MDRRELHGVRINNTLITSSHLTCRRPELNWLTLSRFREVSSQESKAREDILSFLDNEHVVSFTLSKDKTFVEVMEDCDSYYFEYLSSKEMDDLIIQLQAMRQQMV